MDQETTYGTRDMPSREIVRGALIGGLLGVLCGVAIGGVIGWIVQLMHRWHDEGTPPWESVAQEFSHAPADHEAEITLEKVGMSG
jgi:hypothetical protein